MLSNEHTPRIAPWSHDGLAAPDQMLGFIKDIENSSLKSRVAVDEFSAQKHLSGVGAPGIDLHGIIRGISNQEKALSVINGVIQKYGYESRFNSMASFPQGYTADNVAHEAHADLQPNTIELTGQSIHSDFSMSL